MDRLIRPTHVSREKYIAFGNKCRSEGREIREVLNCLLDGYNELGESLFNLVK